MMVVITLLYRTELLYIQGKRKRYSLLERSAYDFSFETQTT
jgi:hypothetical protein